MKLKPVAKLDKRNKTKLKRFDNDVMSTNFDVIATFQVFVQFGRKMLFFCKKNTEIRKIKMVLVLKSIFSETAYVCVLTYQISSF